MSDRAFWSSQPRRRPPQAGSMSMRVVYHAQDRFELAIGPVRLDLEPRDLLKLKTLIDRSVHVYADQLRDDRDEPPPGDAEAPPEPDAFP